MSIIPLTSFFFLQVFVYLLHWFHYLSPLAAVPHLSHLVVLIQLYSCLCVNVFLLPLLLHKKIAVVITIPVRSVVTCLQATVDEVFARTKLFLETE